MLLEFIEMLKRMEEKIGNGAMIEVHTSMEGQCLTFKVRWLIGDRLMTRTTTVTKQELSSRALDFEKYYEDRIVEITIKAIETSKKISTKDGSYGFSYHPTED